ncbi:hypothetical protein [Mucilaginibacter lappiensis]|uniref:O-Antigen ligase n=1 Tax=Mucilaginibacter lappiensis TaxID=354630 RepID=A0A841J8B6_9SPHI|nr:hypothetical protein [Mucilaginibacter lappiensis]MBB6127047.1 hypothetical protein [Mucilaginibacter lappiensis]
MLVTIVFLFLNRKLPVEVVFIIGYFIFLNAVDLINGYFSGAAFSNMMEDVKPLLNIFLLCYLSYSINDVKDIHFIIKLLKFSSIVLVIFHLIFYAAYLIFNDFAVLYAAINSQQGDNTVFFFKGESGFLNYTGDLYLCIGFIVWEQYHEGKLTKYLALLGITLAIILTGTRGLIFALGATYFIKLLILKFNYKSIIYIIMGVAFVIGMYLKIKDDIGDKEDSDRIRYETINQVIENVSPVSVLIGHGFGIGVPIRPDHMEISYLEVFHKQGFLGLGYYLLLFIIAYIEYKKDSGKNKIGFFMFVIFVYFLSFTNPYVNHPLGISIISIAIVCMIRLNKFKDQNGLIFQ